MWQGLREGNDVLWDGNMFKHRTFITVRSPQKELQKRMKNDWEFWCLGAIAPQKILPFFNVFEGEREIVS